MEQQKISIHTINDDKIIGKEWGTFNIYQMTWHREHIYCILVDFMGNTQNCMSMYDYNRTGEFINVHGNLSGKLL